MWTLNAWEQHNEWCIHWTLPVPARNKQVGLLVAEGIRELFPSTVGDWKKPYSWTLVSLLDSSGAAYSTIRLILWTIGGQQPASLLVTAKHGKFSSERF